MAQYIPDKILKPFLKSYENDEVWEVHSGDSWLAIFLFKEEEIQKNREYPIHLQMREEYYKLVEKYLELNLSGSEEIELIFDSKENFEKKYDGNWYYYYK